MYWRDAGGIQGVLGVIGDASQALRIIGYMHAGEHGDGGVDQGLIAR